MLTLKPGDIIKARSIKVVHETDDGREILATYGKKGSEVMMLVLGPSTVFADAAASDAYIENRLGAMGFVRKERS